MPLDGGGGNACSAWAFITILVGGALRLPSADILSALQRMGTSQDSRKRNNRSTVITDRGKTRVPTTGKAHAGTWFSFLQMWSRYRGRRRRDLELFELSLDRRRR